MISDVRSVFLDTGWLQERVKEVYMALWIVIDAVSVHDVLRIVWMWPS